MTRLIIHNHFGRRTRDADPEFWANKPYGLIDNRELVNKFKKAKKDGKLDEARALMKALHGRGFYNHQMDSIAELIDRVRGGIRESTGDAEYSARRVPGGWVISRSDGKRFVVEKDFSEVEAIPGSQECS